MPTIRLVTNDREEPEYHDLVVFRKLAELAGEYLRRGRLVHAEGVSRYKCAVGSL